MKFKFLYLLIFLFVGVKFLNSQTIKKTIVQNQFSKEYIQKNKSVTNEINTSTTPSFIKYNLKIVQLSDSPDEVCIPPKSDYAFCTIPMENTLVVINLQSGNIVESIKFIYRPEKMILSKDGKMIYIIANNWTSSTVGPGCVYAINVSDYHNITEMFPNATPQIPYVVVGPFYDIMLDENKSLMYLVDDQWIYVMDIKQNLLVDVYDKPQANGFYNTLAFSNRRIFGLGEVTGYPFYMINLDTRKIKYLTASGTNKFIGNSIPVVSPDGSKVFVTVFNDQYNAEGMDVFNSETGDFETFIPKLTTLGGFVYNKDSSLAYLNQGEFTVTNSQIFNLSTLSKVGEISGGGYSGIASKDKRYLFFTKYGAAKRNQIDFIEYFKLDLTVVDLNNNLSFSIDVTNDSTISYVYRSIALSDNNDFIAVTNPMLKSVSIISNIQEVIPDTVSLITSLESINNTSSQVTFKWNQLPDITNFHIQVSSDETFKNILIQDSLITNTSYTTNSLQGIKQCYWRVRAKNIIGWGNWSTVGNFISSSTTGVENFKSSPTEYSIKQNYPNPFNPITTISYSIPKTSFVNLKVYNILGKEVAALVNEEKEAGNYKVQFSGINLSSGIYFYKIEAGEFISTKKLILIK